jgi:hypothetical protein
MTKNKTQLEYANINRMLDYLNLHGDARRLMLDIWSLIQVFDDAEDGSKIDKEELDRALWAAFVLLPTNEFYVANRGALGGIISVQILKWKAANQVETTGKADEKSFIWRAGYFDILMYVYALVYGKENASIRAADVMGRYCETYEEYKKEFKL